MKINSYGSIPDITKAYSSQRKDRPSAKQDVPITGGEDTLELSVQAREMQDVKAALKDVREVREEKVEQIKKEIRDGAYRVNAGKIAERMIQERLLDKQA
ncbi:MAG: flagellar biosynthesis anti-sigma factor FlgM [Actinobacteria bacterium]|nr:flagellar biosynthesis anti-sigma factor FlgM [Actinomycetota bacterium]